MIGNYSNILLQDIIVERHTVRYRFSVSKRLEKYFTTNEMYVTYDCEVTDIPQSILVIPFVGSVVALAWLTDSVLWVKEMDETFYNALKELKVAYQELYPHYKMGGRVVAAYRKENAMPALTGKSEALLLFSGGIDAHTTYLRNMDKHPLLCNIQGWLKSVNEESQAQKADFKDISNFAKDHNLETCLVRSNFAALVGHKSFDREIGKRVGDSWWHGFQHSMAFISIAIPIAFKNGIKEILIASSHSLGSKGICASYPTTDSEFRYAESGKVIHDSFELTRQDKVRLIVEYQNKSGIPYPIRVCSFNDHNCGVCPKCFRTILEIISEGGDIANFGFIKPTDMKSYYDDYVRGHYLEFGIDREAALFWPEIKKRIKANYDIIEEKEFVDWFMTTDFVGDRKKAVRKYRIKNFFPLVRKKILERVGKGDK